jgi:putative endonuclease
MRNAIIREKQLKKWKKDWKWELIKEYNPNLLDLANDWFTPQEIENYKNGSN